MKNGVSAPKKRSSSLLGVAAATIDRPPITCKAASQGNASKNPTIDVMMSVGDVLAEQALVARDQPLPALLGLVIDDVLCGALAPSLPVEHAVRDALLLRLGDSNGEYDIGHFYVLMLVGNH